MNDDILWKIDSEIGNDKKVVELRRKNEELTIENDYLKRKCSEMGIALKTYEEGRYQEHLENEQLHSIIKEVREYIEALKIKDYDSNAYFIQDKYDKWLGIEEIPNKLLEILDKAGEE